MQADHHSDEGTAQHAGRQPPKLRRAGIILAAVALVIVISGIAIRITRANETRRWTDERAIPSVRLIDPRHDAAPRGLTLPGHLQAYYEAPIFARVSGYLKRWNVDIGAHVRQGQVMAEIDTPETDQQLEQAKADLASARSKEDLAKITAQRWKNLVATDAVSQQESDQKSADYSALQADVAAAEANVNRVQALEAFKKVVAPFDGVVTARKTDIGALINAGSGSGVELFSVADVHKLRIYTQVPQIYAAKIKAGMSATLTVPEHPEKNFTAQLASTSGSISEASGTLLVELEVDNKAGLLTPGGYAELKFALPESPQNLRVPASALIVRHGGVQVATVDKTSHVVLNKVVVGLDFGTEVEILAGLDPDNAVIDSPPDSIEQGDLVHIEPKGSAMATASGTGNE